MTDVINVNEARLNITYGGCNSDLPDPVAFDASDADVRQWATEAIRAGIPGMPADPNANLQDFVVDRFAANDVRPYQLISVRPKTPFGSHL